jgi:hypothetical protein
MEILYHKPFDNCKKLSAGYTYFHSFFARLRYVLIVRCTGRKSLRRGAICSGAYFTDYMIVIANALLASLRDSLCYLPQNWKLESCTSVCLV